MFQAHRPGRLDTERKTTIDANIDRDQATPRRTGWRYRWDHRASAHRTLVRTANRVLPLLPHGLKYTVTDTLRARRAPYRLLGPGAVAIQVGAPRDTLRAGRSRAMAFARRTAPGGRVLVVEPDPASVAEFRRVATRSGMSHVEVIGAAAWSARTTLRLRVDPSHPATNFTDGCAGYADTELGRFLEVTVDAVPLDELAEDAGLTRVDLVSVTTNGAEQEILQGARRILARHRPYVCVAYNGDTQRSLLAGLGYEVLAEDDRGLTFRHR